MIPLPAPSSDAPWPKRFGAAVAHPMRWMDDVTGDGPTLPLLILFGLNAVDELSRVTFNVLAPDIAEHFGVSMTGIVVPFVLAFGAALGFSVWVGNLADRTNRVRLALLGATVFAVFSGAIGFSINVWMLGFMFAGSQLGKSVIDPAHNSLIADYYPVHLRPRVYSFHRAGNPIGAIIAGISAGLLAENFGWRVPFFVFVFPTLLLVVVGLRLKEPVRGIQERLAFGSTGESADTEEEPPSFAEAWRMCWKIDSLRRIYRTLPFLAPAIAGFALFAGFLYEEKFGLDAAARGFIAAGTEPFQLVGLIVGARLGMKLFAKDPKLIFGLLSKVMVLVTICALIFAWAPHYLIAVAANAVITGSLSFVLPGIFAALSLAIPPRARSTGFAMASVFVLQGIVVVPLIALLGDAWGIEWGMTLMTPMFLIGGLVIASAGDVIQGDIAEVWKASAARSEALYERRQGRSKLLLVRGVNVSYGDVQVLFNVDFEVDEGEIVALLGTNGAGKSTLLKAISGIAEAGRGAVIFDGVDITHAPPNEIAHRGVVQVPGGKGVFPSLSVAENLRTAAWIDRKDRALVATRIEEVLVTFPILKERYNEPAANLSGGQQQMLALGMAFLSRPKLIMIDELSLGLAPVIVEQLLVIVKGFAAQGTTVIVVEQSVNVALDLAETAFFMEKGEIRFHGPTSELLDRPDVLRSVFLEGAAKGMETAAHDRVDNGSDARDLPSTATAASRESGLDPGSTTNGDAHTVPPTGESALEVVGISRSFGGIRAVSDVSFTVGEGEIVGLIGPNGAGKTTIFDLISGFTSTDTGRVLLGGTDISSLPAHRRSWIGLGRSFQDAALFPALTVEQTIAVSLERWLKVRDPILAALRYPGVYETERAVSVRVGELIDLLGLEAYRSKFVHELSTGTRRIVDIACLIAHKPRVILLDEPSSGIAQRETEALGPVILRIRDDLEASIVVIEHDMPLLTAVADRLVALDQGRVVTEGDPASVLSHPEVVASYLGNSEVATARSGGGSTP